jgi:hypothetical protein
MLSARGTLLSLASRERSVIGNFAYAAAIGAGAVGVEMSRGPRSQRLGKLIVPTDTQAVMAAANYPPVDEALPLETALAYAITIAIKANLQLSLTGDASVWDPKWGVLIREQRSQQSQRAAH